LNKPSYFGESELGDILSFGFSYVEHEDNYVEYIIASPVLARRIIREVDSAELIGDEEYFTKIWTAKLLVTNKIPDTEVFFSNTDFSVVLELDLNKMEE
jgi:hypothetical protein